MKETEIKALLRDMSLEEKVNQMVQLMGIFYSKDKKGVVTGPLAELGFTEETMDQAGSILGTYGARDLMEIQKKQMERQPHHIPMLFMMDVIHGMKTIFPMPLAQGATFEPELSRRCAAAAAREAAVSGLHVTFSPMVDLVRDARWGRVMESTGEDPYLNGQMAAAQVRGFQGEDMSEPGKVCACVKHFAAYGGATAGRDYNTVELSEHTLRDFYLPAYQAGVEAGVGMIMTSFNTVNGIPASTNRWLMRDILRQEMGFEGVLISDFAAIGETVVHGHSEDLEGAAKMAVEAGVDIDMMSKCYGGKLTSLVREGIVEEALVDECALRVLRLKNKLGLFENPYKDADPEMEKEVLLCPEHRALAREAAGKACVLLKNEGALPVDGSKRVAFVGPYTDCKYLNSSWAFIGDTKDCVTLREAAEEVFDRTRTSFHPGAPMLTPGQDDVGKEILGEHTMAEAEAMIAEAVEAAGQAELVVLPLGEWYQQSGEAASRAMLDLPEIQMRLLRRVAEVNENLVVVLFCGRPLDLREVSRLAKAVLVAWLPGTEGGHGVMDVLTGRVNPSGKLPMSFPYCVGQVPVHYNEYSTGRPERLDPQDHFRSRYLDIPNTPLYPFGFGLSYTEFEISPVELSRESVTDREGITAGVTVKNVGTCAGTEVVQLYIRDIAASVVRPVKELKGFERVTLEPGEERRVEFSIQEPMLRFTRADGTFGSEPGKFHLWIGNSSAAEGGAEFRLED